MASPIGHLIHPSESRPGPGPGPAPLALPPPPSSLATPVYPTTALSLDINSSVTSHSEASSSTPTAPIPQAPRAHANNQSLYQCADCLRRYSRPEHLQRHIATHTLGKRFTCDICSKAFSRADLLKRHRANHQDDNGAKRRRINSSPGAGRVAHACQACAKARVKCEEMKPCSRCNARGLKCEYASSEDAAMHLLHLSANARSIEQESSPDSPFSPHPPVTIQNQHQQPPNVPSESYSHPNNTAAVRHTSALPAHQSLVEESQVPTPEMIMDHGNPETYHPPYEAPDMDDMAHPPFSDFLRDVLYEQSMQDHQRMAEAQGLAVLDFCNNANLELKDLDFGLLNHWNVEDALGYQQPKQDDSVDMSAMRLKLVKIWTESPWRWNPGKSDTGYTEQSHLPLSVRDAQGDQGDCRKVGKVIKDQLQSSSRDKILAVILSNCRENSVRARVAASFPSTEAMDSWVHIFLASHLCQVSAWIHYGSFSLNSQWPEWLAIAASQGAVLTPVPTLRRFGFALQEAVRLTIPDRFEENNRKIADIGLVQALMMVQDVGLWSGNRRKMEIAECHLSIPIAMMRYRGKFQRSAYRHIVVDASDEGKVLEEKWKTWYEQESWKRLVFHAYLRDAQVSMTQFCNPSMSYAELTLPLPSTKELWFARTAEEFKESFLKSRAAEAGRPPSLVDLLRDINLLSTTHQHLDIQFAISVYLHGLWAQIWEYRQLNAVHRSTSPTSGLNHNLVLSSRHAELCRVLQNFQLLALEWHDMLSAQESIVLHLLLMNLNVCLDDLQLFSGKEGEEQARRIYPTLKSWSDSPEARQALWHAGQILRHGKLFPGGHLKDFYAVAVHHAALCLWTHGVVAKASHPQQGPGYGEELVFLDGEDAPHVHRFLTFGQGRAAIRGPGIKGGDAAQPAISLVKDPRGCMEVAQEVLKANFAGGREGLPPINENIIRLLKQLGNAAWAVGLG